MGIQVQIRKTTNPRNPKHLADAIVTTDDGFKISGFSVVKGQHGLFAGTPSVKDWDAHARGDTKKYIDSVTHEDPDAWKSVKMQIVAEYKRLEGQTANATQTQPTEPVAQNTPAAAPQTSNPSDFFEDSENSF